jgi:hypothetical protein
MSRTTSAATSGGIAAELRNWARGCYSTEAAVELLIRARGGRFMDQGQPWLRTDDRGVTWLDPEVTGQCSQAVSSGERHLLALVEALAAYSAFLRGWCRRRLPRSLPGVGVGRSEETRLTKTSSMVGATGATDTSPNP